MHGLIFCTVQAFVQDTYGPEAWSDIVEQASIDVTVFEAMFHYEPQMLEQVFGAATNYLNKPCDAFLEDLGLYLVSHPKCEGLRRLLRFSGDDFIDFLHSLEDLPGRTRLAVSDLKLPELELNEHAHNNFILTVGVGLPGFGHMLQGLLQAMADDYGALVLMEHQSAKEMEQIAIQVIESAYTTGKDFTLSAHGSEASL